MEINGVAHVMLTVSNFDACLPFHEKLLPFLGMRPVIKQDGWFYCVGGRTAVGIMRAEERHQGERFVQLRVGLHHVCFRVRERADVDAVHDFLVGIGAPSGPSKIGRRMAGPTPHSWLATLSRRPKPMLEKPAKAMRFTFG